MSCVSHKHVLLQSRHKTSLFSYLWNNVCNKNVIFFRANSKISQVVFIHKDALPTINKFEKEHVKIEDKKYVKIITNISDDKKNK